MMLSLASPIDHSLRAQARVQLRRGSSKASHYRRTTQHTTCGADEDVSAWIKDNMGSQVTAVRGAAGGSGWSSCSIFETADGRKMFVKSSRSASAISMFAGEAEGLKALAAPNCMRIPEIYGYGELPSGGAFIAMEYLTFGGRASDEEFGRALAQLHMASPSPTCPEALNEGKFGFKVNNTIGETPQPNPWTDDWVVFLRDHRLHHQLRLARDPELMKLGEKLMDNLGDYFIDVEVNPSILHGDLWSGNITSVDGQPAVFDPAVYYGHHEAEFGMSWCAGFGNRFWSAYHEIIPKAPGFDERKKIYELYHYLNHYNLFGGGYYGTSKSILRNLVS